MLSVVKMLLKRDVGGRALNSHRNYIADHGKSWKNHGIVLLNFCGNPVISCFRYFVQEVSNFVDSEDIVGLHNVHGTVHLLGSLTKCEYYRPDARKLVFRGL